MAEIDVHLIVSGKPRDGEPGEKEDGDLGAENCF